MNANCWLVIERLTAAVTDVQDTYSLTFNREENPIHVRRVTIEQLAYFEGEGRVLRG